MSRLVVIAEDAAGGIAGLDGEFEWGDAATAAPGADVPGGDVVVALGTAGAPGAMRFDDWTHSAWPVRDSVFELPPPDPAGGLLLVTGGGEPDALLLEKLANRGIPVRSAGELGADELTSAAAVAFQPGRGEDGEYVPGALQESVPAAAFAPLAARRPLIAPRARVTFGLHAGVDHLGASTDDDVVQWAAALLGAPELFRPQVALGRIAAERQRASAVYGRLVTELIAAGR